MCICEVVQQRYMTDYDSHVMVGTRQSMGLACIIRTPAIAVVYSVAKISVETDNANHQVLRNNDHY